MEQLSSTEHSIEQIVYQEIEHQKSFPSKQGYLQLSSILEELNQPKSAMQILQEGLQVYPTSMQLHQATWTFYSKHQIQNGKLKHIPRTIKRRLQKGPINFFNILESVLLKKHYNEAYLALIKARLQENPEQISLLTKVIQQLLNLGYFKETLPYFETLKSLAKDSESLAKLHMKIGMVYILSGNFEEAEKQFSYCREAFADILETIYPEQYEKLVIFNNGESLIEYYKYIYPTKKVVATFDAIDKTNTAKPFAYKILKKKQVDLISLRRRTLNNYHQDLSREDYYQAIKKLVSYYNKRFAYGTSLGGYNALYLGSMIPNIKILAMAPRNPAHPIYGTKERKTAKFNHPLSHPVNKDLRPIVLFDPKERIDNPYITKEIMHSYPNGIYKEFYFAGHRVPTYLREIGVLKEVVSLFLGGKPIPDYDRKLHRKSAEYHRVLGIHCRRHNKLRWALDLANRSIELAPKYDRSLALRIEILQKLKRYDDCIVYANEAIQIHPKLDRFYILLADAYEGKGEFIKAIEVLTSANKKKVKSRKIKEKLANLKRKAK